MPGKKPTHTGRDATKEATGIKHEISIHAPHTGRDSVDRAPSFGTSTFQSTRPIRGATWTWWTSPPGKKFQSTRPIRGATTPADQAVHAQRISIHAPHTGRDSHHTQGIVPSQEFQSTRPIRGATPMCLYDAEKHFISIHAPHTGRDVFALSSAEIADISIHAPHTGRDSAGRRRMPPRRYFNPRAPYGARHPCA